MGGFVVRWVLRCACMGVSTLAVAQRRAWRSGFGRGLLAALITLASTADATTVQYAGLSFISDHAQIRERFPYSAKVLEFDPPAMARPFEAHLRERVRQVAHPRFAIAIDGLGNVREGVSRALSFAVSGESFELQRFEGKALAIYALSAQLLFFDLSPPQRLLASYPVRVRFSDISDAPPTPEQIAETFRRMYFDSTHPASLTSRWIERLATVEFADAPKLMQVRGVALEDKAQVALPAGVSPELVAAEIAQFFEAAVSARVGLPMVPYTAGHAIGKKIPMRFADGEGVDLSLSEPTFAFTLTVRELRKMQVDAGAAWQVAYGSFVTLQAESVAVQETLANAKFRLVESVTLPKRSGIQLDDWAQHRVVLQTLLDKLAKQMRQPEPDWVRSTSSTQDVIAQLHTLSQRLH